MAEVNDIDFSTLDWWSKYYASTARYESMQQVVRGVIFSLCSTLNSMVSVLNFLFQVGEEVTETITHDIDENGIREYNFTKFEHVRAPKSDS